MGCDVWGQGRGSEQLAVYERDETAYLLRSPANRERLLRAVADVESTQNVVVPEQEQFQ